MKAIRPQDAGRLRHLYRGQMKAKLDQPDRIAGRLGDAAGNIKVPGTPNLVYVRIPGQPVAVVYCDKAALSYGSEVWLGHDPLEPHLWRVLGVRSLPRSGEDDMGIVSVGQHGETHRLFGTGPGGGTDPAWIEGRQIMPLRIGPAGMLSFSVYKSLVFTGGAIREVVTQTIDLGDYLPMTGNDQALLVLVTVNNAGEVVVTPGAETALADLTAADMPDWPVDTAYLLGVVRLYGEQAALLEGRTITDFGDFRSPILPHASTTHIDMPYDLAGEAGKALAVRADESGYETVDGTILAGLTVEESDEDPSITGVKKLIFPGGSVVDAGGGAAGIRIVHQATHVVHGTLAVSTGQERFPNLTGGDLTIALVHVLVHGAPIGADLIVDVHLMGTTIFTEQLNRPTVPDGDNEASSADMDVTTWPDGDYITVDIDQVGSVSPGTTITVSVKCY